MRTFDAGAKVTCVAWNPNASLGLVAVSSARQLSVLNANIGDKLVIQASDNVVNNIDLEKEKEEQTEEDDSNKTAADWVKVSSTKEEDKDAFKNGMRLKVTFPHDVSWSMEDSTESLSDMG